MMSAGQSTGGEKGGRNLPAMQHLRTERLVRIGICRNKIFEWRSVPSAVTGSIVHTISETVAKQPGNLLVHSQQVCNPTRASRRKQMMAVSEPERTAAVLAISRQSNANWARSRSHARMQWKLACLSWHNRMGSGNGIGTQPIAPDHKFPFSARNHAMYQPSITPQRPLSHRHSLSRSTQRLHLFHSISACR